MILREVDQDGFKKTVDVLANPLAINRNALAVAVKFTCKYSIGVELSSKEFSLQDVILGGGPSGEGSLATGFQLSLNAGVETAIKLGERQEVTATWKVTTLKEVTFNLTDCSVTQGNTEVPIVKNKCFSKAVKVTPSGGTRTTQAFSYQSFSTVGATTTTQTMKCALTICMDNCHLPEDDNDCLGDNETEFAPYQFSVDGYTNDATED